MTIIPPYLQPGDTIGIVCPSGYMPHENIETCLNVLQQWGFKVKKGKTLGTHFNYFSGTDEERLEDLQAMMDDAEIKAILCARGGYGLSRIIDEIRFDAFLQHPKWIIGYSDITVLHSHLFQVYNVASLHSPMAGAFNEDGYKSEYVRSLRKALLGEASGFHNETNKLNIKGTGTGKLIGGNLALLAHLTGSKSSMQTKGNILFIEDTTEYIYNIDRMMIQLERANLLEGLAGLVVGSFTDMKDTVIPFGQSVYDTVYEKVKDRSYPVCFDFPVGHSPKNYALKHGITHTLEVSEEGVTLKEEL